jgi:hypothetical protein
MTEEAPKVEQSGVPEKMRRFVMAKASFRIRLGEVQSAGELMAIGIKVQEAVKEAYPKIDPRRYQAFHMLIGSTIPEGAKIDGFDWEGPTSVVETLEKEIKDRGWN